MYQKMKLTTKYPFIIFPKVSDCIVCAFKMILEPTVLFGSECPHMNKAVLKPRLYTTKWRLLCYLVLNWALFCAWANNFCRWNTPSERDEGFIEDMFCFLLQTWTLVLMLSIVKNRHLYIKYFHAVSEILSKSKRFGVPSLLPPRNVERVQYGSLYMIILCGTIACHQMFARIRDYGFGYMNLTRAVSSFLNIMYGGSVTIHTIFWITVYEGIFRKLLELLKQQFEYRKRYIHTDLTLESPFATKLRLYQSFYSSCVLNYENQVLVYTSLVFDACHFIIIIVCQVFSFLYIAFLMVQQDFEMKEGATAGLLQSFYIVSFSYYLLKRTNNIYNISNDFISYLHKYPISRLTQEESLLVEALIHNLTNSKPILVPADIFELHRKMIPSIVGHVITYSLVAMQFNIFTYFY